QSQGDYAGARGFSERALAMRKKMYPVEGYPSGHPELASSLNNLGALLEAEGDYPRARDYLETALAMYLDLAEDFTASSSEAEALNPAPPLPPSLDRLLSVSRRLLGTDEAIYVAQWRTKASIMRSLQRRYLAQHGADDPHTRDLVNRWQEARRALSRL